MLQIDEPITVVPYDPLWPQLFQQEQAYLKSVLGHQQTIEIQHFGSTAVPGLAAKPIVDILVGLPELKLELDQIEALAQLGYEYLGEAGVPGRLALRKRGAKAFNLAVVEWNGPLWQDNLLVRDYLRTHPAAAQQYARHKEKAVAAGKTRLLPYSEAKRIVINELLERARAWGKRQIKEDRK